MTPSFSRWKCKIAISRPLDQMLRLSDTQPQALDWKPAPYEIANSIEDEFMPRNPRVVINPEKQSRVRRAMKVESLAELLQLHGENCSLPLTAVPFRNGILEKDSTGKFYDETYRIDRLFFNGNKRWRWH